MRTGGRPNPVVATRLLLSPSPPSSPPPSGDRLGEGADLADSWKALGNFLHRCPGATAWILSGNAELTRHLGLSVSRKYVVMNGPIECRLLKYEIRAKAARV